MTQLTEAQVWVLIAVFATVMFGVLTVQTNSFNRTLRAAGERTDAKIDGLREATDAKFDRMREVTDARFDLIDSRFDDVNSKIDSLDRDVQALTRHVFGG